MPAAHAARGVALIYSRQLEDDVAALTRSLRLNPNRATARLVTPASFEMYIRGSVPFIRQEDHAHMLNGLRNWLASNPPQSAPIIVPWRPMVKDDTACLIQGVRR